MSATLASIAPTLPMNTGLNENARQELARKVNVVLADTFMLFIKTQGVHWNVAGPAFHALHNLTEEQYRDQFDAVDDLAERIRALGEKAPASYKTYGEISTIVDRDEPKTAEDMVAMLVADNEEIVRKLRDLIGEAEEMDDWATHDLLTDRIIKHEEAIWMLRATIS